MNYFGTVRNSLKIIFGNKQIIVFYLLCQIINYCCILYCTEAGMNIMLSSDYLMHSYVFERATEADLTYIDAYARDNDDIQYVVFLTPDGAECVIKQNRPTVLVAGKLPDNDAVALQTALPQNLAEELGVTPGSQIQTGDNTVTVTGILKDGGVLVNKAYIAYNGFNAVTVKSVRYDSRQIDALTDELVSRGATYGAPPSPTILLLMRENPLSLVMAALAGIIAISAVIIYKYYYLRLRRYYIVMRQEGCLYSDMYFSTALTFLVLAALISVSGSVIFGIVGFIAGSGGGMYVMSGYSLGAAEYVVVALAYLAAVLALSLLYITAVTRKKLKTND